MNVEGLFAKLKLHYLFWTNIFLWTERKSPCPHGFSFLLSTWSYTKFGNQTQKGTIEKLPKINTIIKLKWKMLHSFSSFWLATLFSTLEPYWQ